MDEKHYNTVRNVLKTFILKHRQYRTYSINNLVVDKVWNRGMGIIPLVKVSNSEPTLWVAKDANKSDLNHLVELIDELNKATGKRYVWMSVGRSPYPSMSLQYPNEKRKN